METNCIHEPLEVLESNCNLSEAATVGTIDILGEDKILTLRVLPTEYPQVGSLEVGSGPFAFDGDWGVPSASQDEVNFVATFAANTRPQGSAGGP